MFDPLRHLASYVNLAEGPILIATAGKLNVELASDPHRHSRGQLFGSLRGLLSVGVEDGIWIVPAIHAVWLPPHTEHSARAHGPIQAWNVYVTEAACATLPVRPCTIRTSGLLREAVIRAATWPLEMDCLTGDREHIASVILDEIRNLPVESLGLPLPRDARLQRVARALIADPADARELEGWASLAAVSSRTLSRRFVLETGFNFAAWRQRARMMRALEMLASGLPVTAIALDLGYATASAFIGVFRRTFGETPAVYRMRLSM